MCVAVTSGRPPSTLCSGCSLRPHFTDEETGTEGYRPYSEGVAELVVELRWTGSRVPGRRSKLQDGRRMSPPAPPPFLSFPSPRTRERVEGPPGARLLFLILRIR